MGDKPRRFRFSLITIIVVVNVAGLLLWANVSIRTQYFLMTESGTMVPKSLPLSAGAYPFIESVGWPFESYRGEGTVKINSRGDSYRPKGIISSNIGALPINAVISLALLSGIAALTETFVRKEKHRVNRGRRTTE